MPQKCCMTLVEKNKNTNLWSRNKNFHSRLCLDVNSLLSSTMDISRTSCDVLRRTVHRKYTCSLLRLCTGCKISSSPTVIYESITTLSFIVFRNIKIGDNSIESGQTVRICRLARLLVYTGGKG